MTPEVTAKVEAFFGPHQLRSVPKGKIMIFAGEDPEGVSLLVKGRIRQYDISPHGDEVVINVFKPGAFFPMAWAINGTPNAYFFKAETSSAVRVAPAEDVLAFIRANPDVMLDLLSRLYRGMDGVLGRMVQLMSGGAEQRLIYELIISARRFGERQKDGWHLKVSESDLAARAGLTRETISREIHKLKNLDLVKVQARRIIISDLPALERLLETS